MIIEHKYVEPILHTWTAIQQNKTISKRTYISCTYY